MRIEVNVITGEITEHEDAPVTVEEVAPVVEEVVAPVEETPAPTEGV